MTSPRALYRASIPAFPLVLVLLGRRRRQLRAANHETEASHNG